MSYTSAKSRPTDTFDAELEFKDAGLVAADAAATVDGVARIIDAGSGLFEADMIIDVTAIEIASNDENYNIKVQGSNSATFASGIEDLASIQLGALETLIGGDVDSDTGRYVLPFRNERNNRYYRYLRVYTDVAGAIATGINFAAYAVPHH